MNSPNLKFPCRFACLLVALGLGALTAWAQTLAPGVKLVPVAMGHALENINSQSFSRNTLYTVGNTQYITFYSATTNIVVARRQLGTTNWEFRATSFMPNSAIDGHDIVSLGVSGDGILHLSWGMHGDPYHYARTLQPWSLDLVAASMTGAEGGVTYPQFINCPNGDLLYIFREGGSGSGNTFINRYSATTHTWTNVNYSAGQQPFIKGLSVPGSVNCSAYPNFECLDSRTNLHLTWCWRNTGMGINGNQDTLYARSSDYGVTWQKWNGANYTLPITRVTADNIYPIATNHDLMNESGQCLDTNNRPVVCNWWAPQGTGTPLQFSIIWNDGIQWRRSQITSRTTTSAQTWPTRPLIVCDKQNRLWVVFTDPERGSVPTLAWSSDPNRTNWNFANLTSQYMGDGAINTWGGWEATYDPAVWQRDGKLHLFYQPITHVTTGTLISVLEFEPEVFLSNQPPPQVTFEWSAPAGSGLWSRATNWTNNLSPPAGGGVNLGLSFRGANAWVASNDLAGSFVLNSLALNNPNSGTNQLLGNALAFTGNLNQPALAQGGTASWSILNPLWLSNSLAVSPTGSGFLELRGPIAGQGGISVSGGGTLILSGTNQFAGGLTQSAGVLAFGSDSFASGPASFGGCTLRWLPGTSYDFSAHRTNTLTSTTTFDVNGNDVVLNGSFGGAGGVSVSAAGGGSLTLSASNSYAGSTSVNQGQLIAANSAALGVGAAGVSIVGGYAISSLGLRGGLTLAKSLSLGGRQPLPNPSGAAAHVVNLSGTNRIVGTVGSSTGGNQSNIECADGLLLMEGVYAQSAGTLDRYLNLQGEGPGIWTAPVNDGTARVNVTKRGAGCWTLAGTNGYTGQTLVTEGVLLVNGVLGTNAVTVTNGGLGGTGVVNGPVTVQSGGRLVPGSLMGKLVISNNLSLHPGSQLQIALSKGPVTNSFLEVSGTFDCAGQLVVTNLGTLPLSPGDSFRILRAGKTTGALAGIVPPIPAPGLRWVTNNVLTDGILSIAAAPRPVVSQATITAPNLCLSVSNGFPGSTFWLLGATNLAQPLGRWSVLATNQFDGLGKAAFTHPASRAPGQMFYCIEAP